MTPAFKYLANYYEGKVSKNRGMVQILLTLAFRRDLKTLNTFLSLNREPRRIWCAASSTGEEVYSIAMTVVKAYGSFEPPVEIIATDIDSNVLLKANQGIYTDDTASSLTYDDKKRFFHKEVIYMKMSINKLDKTVF